MKICADCEIVAVGRMGRGDVNYRFLFNPFRFRNKQVGPDARSANYLRGSTLPDIANY